MPRVGIFVQLDVEYSNDIKIRQAGEAAEVLYLRSLCWSKRMLTDGFIAEELLKDIVRTRSSQRAEKLVEVGLWERVAGGYRIVSWSKWNKSRGEIEARKARQSAAALQTNHKRYHADKAYLDPGCDLCITVAPANASPNAPVIAPSGRTGSPETETETETPSESEARRDEVVAILTERRMGRVHPAPHNPAAYRARVAASVSEEMGSEITLALGRFPEVSVAAIADKLDSDNPFRPTVPAAESMHPSLVAERRRRIGVAHRSGTAASGDLGLELHQKI